jgi:hypothetical protein
MRIRLSGFSGVCLAVLLGLVLTLQLGAKTKTAKAKTGTIQGTVQSLDKSKMIITVANGNVKKEVMYAADTQFMSGHSKDSKPGSVDEVKDNYYVSCGGSYEAGKVQLHAKKCVYREHR